MQIAENVNKKSINELERPTTENDNETSELEQLELFTDILIDHYLKLSTHEKKEQQ